MSIRRDQFTENYKETMYNYFWEAYPDKPPKHELVFDVMQSDSAYEQFTSAIGLGELLEKPESEDIQADAPMESYTIVIKNRLFARKVRFSYESVQDSKKTANLLSTTVGTWGRQVPITKEKFYSKFFNYGAYTAGNSVFNNTISNVVTDSSGNFIYDGNPFFYTAHPDKVGNTYSNYNAATSLTHDNLKTVYNTFTTTNNRDERGDVIELVPDTILIPPALGMTAKEILKSVMVPDVFNNTINVLQDIVEPIEWSYLTDTDGWFLGNRKMGITATSREDVNLDFYRDEENLDYVARIVVRFGGGVTQWRHWLANNISTS